MLTFLVGLENRSCFANIDKISLFALRSFDVGLRRRISCLWNRQNLHFIVLFLVNWERAIIHQNGFNRLHLMVSVPWFFIHIVVLMGEKNLIQCFKFFVWISLIGFSLYIIFLLIRIFVAKVLIYFYFFIWLILIIVWNILVKFIRINRALQGFLHVATFCKNCLASPIYLIILIIIFIIFLVWWVFCLCIDILL